MAAKTLVVACVLILGLGIVANGAPTDATQAVCKIAWMFGVPCDQVNMAIVSQVKAMGSYKLGPVTAALIQANHTSSVGQIESVNFTVMPTAMSMGCHTLWRLQ